MPQFIDRNRSRIIGILLLTPAALLILNAFYIPIIWNVILSFQHWDGFGDKVWAQLDNYKDLFQDSIYWKSVYHSLYIAVGSTFVAVFVGLILAILIFKVSSREGAFFRLVFFLPVMLPLAVVALLYTFVYNPEMGMLNQLLKIIGLGNLQHAWLADPNTVLAAITFVGAWKSFGLTMILCFAAIQSIPTSLMEASRIDGAGYFRQVFSIILPLIKPIILLSVVFTLTKNFKTYDLVFVMTRGGPGNASQIVPIYMLNTGFSYNEFGYAAAMACVLTVIVIIITIFTRLALRGENYEY